MPIELFGFKLGKKKKSNKSTQPQKVESFVAPDKDEGATYVDGGGYFSAFIDFDTKAQTDIEYISKYREMSLYPEVESAIEDICNESIVYDDNSKSIELFLDKVDLSDNIKEKITEEFNDVYRLLEFNQRGYEIFRKWYIDGRLYYHIIVDDKKLKEGVKEVRYIDPQKIKKIIETETETNDQGVKIVKKIDEYFTYFEDETVKEGIRIAPEAILLLVFMMHLNKE